MFKRVALLFIHMGKRVLVPVDGSAGSEQACDLACELFARAEIILFHVINPADAGFASEATIPGVPDQWYEQQRTSIELTFDDIETRHADAGVEFLRKIEVGQPARAIVELADREGVDHLVMGSTGRQGVSRLLLGSVAERVIRRSPVPVTIAR